MSEKQIEHTNSFRARTGTPIGKHLLALASPLTTYVHSVLKPSRKNEGEPTIAPQDSVKAALYSARKYFGFAALFSGCINILTLSGSLFMLQVYDRVLPSHSRETLLALVVLVIFLYALCTLLEGSRSKLFARIGRYIDVSLRDAVFSFNLATGLPNSRSGISTTPFRDLEQLRTFLASGGPSALFDLPWTPIYIILLFLLHPYLGFIGLLGIIGLSFATWLADRATSPHQKTSVSLAAEASALSETVRQSAETVKPLGMARGLQSLWLEKHQAAGEAVVHASDKVGLYGGISRFMRLSLQSVILATGAYLVISGKATGGVMIASSILLGKAMGPVELAINHWRGFTSARQAYQRLEVSTVSEPSVQLVQLPAPQKKLSIQELSLGVPGEAKPILANITFELNAGDALGVLGPSGAGKSTLMRALVGAWPIMQGTVRLDGSALDQWSEDDVGSFTGYLPQSVDLFAGTIGQNISRFRTDASDRAVLEAAQIAGIDEYIRSMSKGFNTDVGLRGGRLSAGQRQRIALARALYGNPFFVVLDEPNSAMDTEGELALLQAISSVRKRGGIAVIAAHRPNVLQTVNKVLILAKGKQQAFGPRDEILKKTGPTANKPLAEAM